MLKYDIWYFPCTLYSMSGSLVKYEVVHACFSYCNENDKCYDDISNKIEKCYLPCSKNSTKNSCSYVTLQVCLCELFMYYGCCFMKSLYVII